MIVKLLTEHHLKCLSLKEGCRGSSESSLDKLLEISCCSSIIVFLNDFWKKSADDNQSSKYYPACNELATSAFISGQPIFSIDIHPDGSRFATGGQGLYRQ